MRDDGGCHDVNSNSYVPFHGCDKTEHKNEKQGVRLQLFCYNYLEKYWINTMGREEEMSKADINVLEYIVVCISEFARQYKMHMRDAYIYLDRYKGIEFLKEFYDVEHTLSFEDVMNDVVSICRKNGGAVL